MKNLFVLLSLTVVLASCKKNDSANTTLENLNNALQFSGGYSITTFIEEGEDKTPFFNQYSFVFSSNGTVTATSASQTRSGQYSVFIDDGRTELSMFFPNATGEFSELNDDWYFISNINNTIRFEDNGDLLIFQQL
jgi:hypothetical protein